MNMQLKLLGISSNNNLLSILFELTRNMVTGKSFSPSYHPSPSLQLHTVLVFCSQLEMTGDKSFIKFSRLI